MRKPDKTPVIQSSEFRSLSPATHRGSTIIFPDYQSFINRGKLGRSGYNYGLNGTPTSRHLSQQITDLEGGCDTFLTSSGLMAITVTLLACLSSGDGVCFPETVYAPVRRFASRTLSKMGIEVAYYDPCAPDDIDWKALNLRLVWIESPGSVTMEVQDFRAIVDLANTHDVLTGCDNSWASLYFCRPLEMGVDIVVEAVTKYLSGHSDLLMGSITARNEEFAGIIYETIQSLGVGVSPDDCFLALRGMETAELRLRRVSETAQSVATQLAQHPIIEEVLYPACEGNEFHNLWRAQYSGAGGVLSFIVRDEDEHSHASRFDRIDEIKLGASWGGTHSLISPAAVEDGRRGGRYDKRRIVRLSVGLESQEEILSDLASFLS